MQKLNLKTLKMALLLLSFVGLLSLTSCGNSPKGNMKVSPELTQATPSPTKPSPVLLQSQAADYVVEQKQTIAECNADKAAIAEILNVKP